MKGKILIFVIVILIAAGAAFILNKKKTAQAPTAAEQGPMPMPVAQCAIQDVTDYYEFTGTTEAVDSVEIRARVEGYLQGIHFTDGSLVEEGQLLFTIEPEAFEARRNEAAAQLKAAKAQLQQAQVDLERIEQAIETNAVSQQDLTRSRAAADTASASVLAAEATLARAELDLSYTEIRSPIRGRIARRLADIGNLVGPVSRPILTTVKRTQPIYIYFYLSESQLKGDLPDRIRGGAGLEPLGLEAALSNETEYLHKGIVNYLDNSVNSKTGTVYVRGQLDNKDDALLPGMFVRVRVPIRQRKNAVLIPEKAIMTDLGGKYVLTVGPGNVLQRHDIKLGTSQGLLQVINEGLDGSEVFIIGGFHIARPGMPITPMPAGGPPATAEKSGS